MGELEKFGVYVLEYIVLPVAGWLIYFSRQTSAKMQTQEIDIAVLRTQLAAQQSSHEREMSEMKALVTQIFTKLDSIEASLRK